MASVAACTAACCAFSTNLSCLSRARHACSPASCFNCWSFCMPTIRAASFGALMTASKAAFASRAAFPASRACAKAFNISVLAMLIDIASFSVEAPSPALEFALWASSTIERLLATSSAVLRSAHRTSEASPTGKQLEKHHSAYSASAWYLFSLEGALRQLSAQLPSLTSVAATALARETQTSPAFCTANPGMLCAVVLRPGWARQQSQLHAGRDAL
mmetsp:Transcript_60915/g.145173  ORF Transcript_60915/g.145173 Transcript_60915/m.145173 type:complete len:217 (-) Transcript_60915:161-811(-)